MATKHKKIIIGNWKMYVESEKEAKKLVSDIKKTVSACKRTDVVVCPPFPFIASIKEFATKKLSLGSQTVSIFDTGAHTSEVSAKQLKSIKVSHSIVGHSENRKAGESDEVVSKKLQMAFGSGIRPILCIGEETRSTSGEYLFAVEKQLKASLSGMNVKDIGSLIIAYEPVWAIGSKEAMNSHSIHEMVLYIKKVLKSIVGPSFSVVPILYGGAVSPENTADIITNGMVDGLLIGRDSVDAKRFASIIQLVDKLS
jgi:triosephosphate isomerase